MMLVMNLMIGLGIFLFGMTQLEHGIESLNSHWIKEWLRKNTHRPLNSVFTGTVATAIVQSSSMISLVLLAFASANIIPLSNAIGVLLGANLGTTFTGWIVATLGFKLHLDAIALPTIGLGALIQVFGEKSRRLSASGVVLFGFGLLLFGLSLMKDAVAILPEQFNIERLQDFNAFSFLLLGTLLTAIIQSSSATMMIALTALSSGIISLPGAAALVIGADLGTTSTTVLGSVKGSPVKRQLALAHFLFNLITNFLAFVILLPLLPKLMNWLTITDPLYSLVAFHSFFNVFGLFLFLPFLKQYANWIGQRFLKEEGEDAAALAHVPVNVPEAAITACEQHVKALIASALSINLRNLHIEPQQLHLSHLADELLATVTPESQNFDRRYEMLKQHEGELLRYAAQVQPHTTSEMQSSQITQLLDCARDAVYAAKTLKDIRPNLAELRHTEHATLQRFSNEYQARLKPFYKQLTELLASDHDTAYLREQLQILTQQNEQLHDQLHEDIQTYSGKGTVKPEQLSTLFNVNREVWQSNNSLLDALRHWYAI